MFKSTHSVLWRLFTIMCVLIASSYSAIGQKKVNSKSIRPVITYTFMGLVAGQSQEEASSVIQALNSTFSSLEQIQPPTCSNTFAGLSGPGLNACFYSVRYASLPAYSRSHSFVLLFVDGKLARADYQFDIDAYEPMITSIVKKYGEPSESKVVTMTNSFGNAMPSRNYIWKSGSSQLGASELSSTSEKSAVHIEDVQLKLEFERRARENGPKI